MASPTEEIEIIGTTIDGQFIEEPDSSQETRGKLLDSLLDLQTLIADKKIEKAKEGKPVNCFKCGQKFSKTNISKHYKNCDGLVNKTITCCKCHNEFTRRGYNSHFKNCKGNKKKISEKKNQKNNNNVRATGENQQTLQESFQRSLKRGRSEDNKSPKHKTRDRSESPLHPTKKQKVNHKKQDKKTKEKNKKKREKPAQVWGATLNFNMKNTVYHLLRQRLIIPYKKVSRKNKQLYPFHKYIYKKTFYMDKMFKEIIVSNEKGLAGTPHMHAYLKSKDKLLWKSIRIFLYRLKVNKRSILREVKVCRSTRNWVKYITKEDGDPKMLNIDKEICHNNYQMLEIARITKGNIIKNSYFDMKFQTKNQRDRLYEICAHYRNQLKLKEVTKNARTYVHEDLYLEMKKTTKRGIYIYGPPGTGKSSTLHSYTKGNHFSVPINSKGRFLFSDYQHQKYIVCEDFSQEELQSMRTTINQLTDDHGLTYGEIKGGGLIPVNCKQFIITSNDEPPIWNGFERRFTCIHVPEKDIANSDYVEPITIRLPKGSPVVIISDESNSSWF